MYVFIIHTLNQNTKSSRIGTEGLIDNLSNTSQVNQLPATQTMTEENGIYSQTLTTNPSNQQINSAIVEDRSQQMDRNLVLDTILDQVNKESINEEDWMKTFGQKLSSRFQRMPKGGWKRVNDEFNKKFGKNYSLTEVKNMHIRLKPQIARKENSDSNPNGGGDILEPIKVKNAQTYARVKTCLYNNLEKICQTQDNRMRTKKIYSQEVNHDIIEILNIVIQTEKVDEHINYKRA